MFWIFWRKKNRNYYIFYQREKDQTGIGLIFFLPHYWAIFRRKGAEIVYNHSKDANGFYTNPQNLRSEFNDD
jgi:hypothetical protein